MNNTQITKNELRKKLLELRQNQDEMELELKSQEIINTLETRPEFHSANDILLYYPFKNEVNTIPLIEKFANLKNIYLPKIISKTEMIPFKVESLEDLVPGKFAIMEPVESESIESFKIDLVIIPGIAFDQSGNRLGFGKGYYDYFLKQTTCPKIGLAFEFQIVEYIPSDIYDVKVDMIITESNIINP